MFFSAMASRSPVLMPARTEPRSSSRVSPTSRPATRIFSICSGVLISTPRSRNPMASLFHAHGLDYPSASLTARPPLRLGHGLERVEDPLGDLVDLAGAVDLDEQVAIAVHLDQRLGLVGVPLLATPDHLFGVIRTALGLRPLQQP